MIDLAGASRSATALVRSTAVSKSSLPFIAIKSSWRTQVQGVYDLIYPLLHTDFADRLEVMVSVNMLMIEHCLTNMHFGAYSTPGRPNTLTLMYMPKEAIINKIGRVAMPSEGVPSVQYEAMRVKAMSPCSVIGYGV